jgi:hypothetical protein
MIMHYFNSMVERYVVGFQCEANLWTTHKSLLNDLCNHSAVA